MSEPDIAVLQLLGQRPEQQDAFEHEIVERGGQRQIVIAVADGHGGNGANAAKLAVTKALQMIDADANDLPAVFKRINREIRRRTLAGTTLTLAIIGAGLLTVAYVGDSEAWMLKADRLQRLTVPHRHGSHRGETGRLDRQSGRFSIVRGAIALPSGAYLAVTRALGDVEFEPYVLHDPEVRQIAFGGDERFLLVGSDGFWECTTNRKTSRHQLRSALLSCSSCDEAVRMIAAQIERRRVSDNCTVVLARVDGM